MLFENPAWYFGSLAIMNLIAFIGQGWCVFIKHYNRMFSLMAMMALCFCYMFIVPMIVYTPQPQDVLWYTWAAVSFLCALSSMIWWKPLEEGKIYIIDHRWTTASWNIVFRFCPKQCQLLRTSYSYSHQFAENINGIPQIVKMRINAKLLITPVTAFRLAATYEDPTEGIEQLLASYLTPFAIEELQGNRSGMMGKTLEKGLATTTFADGFTVTYLQYSATCDQPKTATRLAQA